jgi:hypothetical protein
MKSFALFLFVSLAIASTTIYAASASTNGDRESFEHFPSTCFDSFAQAAECRSNLPSNLVTRFNMIAVDRIIPNLRSRYHEGLLTTSSKRSSLGVAEDLADSLLYERSGLADGCFYGFVVETGAITSVPYAQWYDDGGHAPAAYKTYLASSPVNAPVSNCANKSVYYSGPGVESVCDNAHTAMTFCYIGFNGCTQPAECPHEA